MPLWVLVKCRNTHYTNPSSSRALSYEYIYPSLTAQPQGQIIQHQPRHICSIKLLCPHVWGTNNTSFCSLFLPNNILSLFFLFVFYTLIRDNVIGFILSFHIIPGIQINIYKSTSLCQTVSAAHNMK